MVTRLVVGLVLASLLAASAPALAATWESLGPPGVTAQIVVADPMTPDVLYLGVYRSGVWKSTDHGQSWAPTGRGIYHVPYSMAVDPATPSTVYAGSNLDIVRSDDGGASWTHLNAGLMFSENAYALAIDPATPSTIYAGLAEFAGVQTGGVIKSVDRGATWARMNTGLTDLEVYALAIDPVASATVYAGTGSGVFKSIDGGASWALAGTGAGEEARVVVIDPAAPSSVWVGTHVGVFHSIDGGATWDATGATTIGGDIVTIALDPAASGVVYAGSYSGLDKSTDGGATWVRNWGATISVVVDPYHHTRVYSASTNSFFVTGNAGGTWSRSEAGLHGNDLVSLATDLTHPGTFYGSNFHRLYSTSDFGVTWAYHPAPTSDVFYLAVDGRHRRLSFVTEHAVPGAQLSYSTKDAGVRWHPSRGLASRAARTIAGAPSDPRTMYAGTFDGIFKSRNGGHSWRLLRTSPIGPAVVALAVDPTSAATVYAGVDGLGVMKTTDGGITWNATGAGLGDVIIGAIAIDPHDVSTVYAGSYVYGRVFKSTDGGASWNEGSVGLPQGPAFRPSVLALLVDPIMPSTVYAGVGGLGNFRSTDGGASWAEFNPGMPAQTAYGFVVGPASTVYVGTSQGLFRLVTP